MDEADSNWLRESYLLSGRSHCDNLSPFRKIHCQYDEVVCFSSHISVNNFAALFFMYTRLADTRGSACVHFFGFVTDILYLV